MKKIFLLFSIVFSIATFGQETEKKSGPPAGNAAIGDTYGAGVDSTVESKAISTKKLEKKLKKENKLDHTVVEGKVVKVCDKKGCWFTLETENNERFFVKMKDYAFFVPVALEGKKVILEGSAEKNIVSVEEAKHYAEDANKSQAEIDAITKPQNEIKFVASGIKVVE